MQWHCTKYYCFVLNIVVLCNELPISIVNVSFPVLSFRSDQSHSFPGGLNDSPASESSSSSGFFSASSPSSKLEISTSHKFRVTFCAHVSSTLPLPCIYIYIYIIYIYI